MKLSESGVEPSYFPSPSDNMSVGLVWGLSELGVFWFTASSLMYSRQWVMQRSAAVLTSVDNENLTLLSGNKPGDHLRQFSNKTFVAACWNRNLSLCSSVQKKWSKLFLQFCLSQTRTPSGDVIDFCCTLTGKMNVCVHRCLAFSSEHWFLPLQSNSGQSFHSYLQSGWTANIHSESRKIECGLWREEEGGLNR